ncbi:hypothetical protein KGQ90_16380 [Modicisalibacter tunisiensis]|uniref:hypothetical protein n=1 Tax=Modicisalibacter tunisiensis TaxID=390637 RepID=UPI001CCABAE9|nr:hypothetical protein [Modicisalibacter tunisiensis]MBZ9540497.1 hypothetical protein [Modicisalibacter tunisiensis]
MNARTLHDGTPIPEHLTIAHQEAGAMVYEASRIAVALRDLGNVLADEDDPLPDRHKAGLCEAVGLIGDYLEAWAVSRQEFLEHLAREDHARRQPAAKRERAPKGQGVPA